MTHSIAGLAREQQKVCQKQKNRKHCLPSSFRIGNWQFYSLNIFSHQHLNEILRGCSFTTIREKLSCILLANPFQFLSALLQYFALIFSASLPLCIDSPCNIALDLPRPSVPMHSLLCTHPFPPANASFPYQHSAILIHALLLPFSPLRPIDYCRCCCYICSCL